MSNIVIGSLGRKIGIAPPPVQPLDVNVIFTSAKATSAAMREAAKLAADLGAHVRVLAPQVVSFATDLEHPPVSTDFLAARYREIAVEAGVEANVQIVLCRDVLEALRMILRPNSLVLVGGSPRWWHRRERKLARALEAAGHQVLFVTKFESKLVTKESAKCSTCST